MSNLKVFFLFSLVFFSSYSSAEKKYPFSIPNIDVSSYAIMDVKTGSIIAGKDLDKKVEPASLTKIATLYLVFKALESKYIDENDSAVVSKKAWKMVGSRMFVEVGKRVLIKDLITGVIVQSGNDASVVLAEHIAGGEEFFVTMLNKLAKDMGLSNTRFTNVTGMPNKNHYTSARDVVILSQRLIQDFPNQYKKFAQKEFKFNNISQNNRNRLLTTYDNADGIKTGHTKSAGYCLAASAKFEDTRFVVAIFGANTSRERFKHAKTLFKFGFRNFITKKYFDMNQVIARERMWNGEEKYIDIGFNKDIFLTLLKYDNHEITPKINLISKIVAPIRKNQNLGTVDFYKSGEIISSEKIYSLEDVNEGNLFRKTYDLIANFFINE
tara:strand:- start:780 stop:1925 length:1146 start_codon:yes stop_codon:yes gene_type:complete